MKKFSISAISLIAILCCISCTKEKMEEVSPVPDGYVSIQLSAEGESTKTVLNGNAINWVKGDVISVHYIGDAGTPVSDNSTAASDGARTSFSLVIPENLSEMYAAYPAGTAELSNEGSFSVSIPAEQDGEFRNGNYIVAKAAKTGASWPSLSFKNAVAYLKVQTTDAEITKVVFTAVGGEKITGKVIPVFDEQFSVTTDVVDGSESVALNINSVGDHFAAILPGVTLAKGIQVDFYKGEAKVSPSYYYAPETPVTTQRAHIINFSTLDKFIGNYYVSPDGTGSGKDAAHPMGMAKLKSLLEAKTDANEIAAHEAQLDGSTIVFASGEYDMSTSDMFEIAFANYSKVQLTLQGATEGETIFTGKELKQILKIAENTDITVKNITFTKSKGNGGGQAGVSISGSTAKAVFDKCKFTGNTNSATAAGVVVNTQADVTFKDCLFSSNTAKMAAAINIDCANSCFIDHCEFSGNSVDTWHGGAVQIKGSAKLTNCTFTKNSATATDGFGGALVLNLSESEKPVNVENCTFLANTGKKGGAIYAHSSGSVATFTGCTFGDGTADNANTARESGAVAYADDGVKLTFTNCEAAYNKAVWGGFLGMKGASEITIEGGTYSNNVATTGGGVIFVDPQKNVGTLVVKNANFIRNSAQGGGGVARSTKNKDDGAVYSNMTFESCTFTENYSTNGYGGALDLRSCGKSVVKGCVFDGNYTNGLYAYTKGGAINCCAGNAEGGEIEISSCIFKENHTIGSTNYQDDNGGALNVGNQNDSSPSFIAYVNDCVFQSNYACQGGAVNVENTATMYMNACSFTGNYITSKYGTTFFAKAGSQLRLNNISIANDTYSPGTAAESTWFHAATGDIVLSNSTLIGLMRTVSNNTVVPCDGGALFRFANASGNPTFINDIIAKISAGYTCTSIHAAGGNATISAQYCKLSSFTTSISLIDTANDYLGTSSYFGNLVSTDPTSTETASAQKHFYWAWNGTLSTSTSTAKANLTDVNNAIQTVDADFYSWLQSVGGDVNDALGNARGNETWPGAYQGTQSE